MIPNDTNSTGLNAAFRICDLSMHINIHKAVSWGIGFLGTTDVAQKNVCIYI